MSTCDANRTENKIVTFFFLFLVFIQFFNRYFRLLFLSGNKRDEIESLTQRAERSQFADDYFLR